MNNPTPKSIIQLMSETILFHSVFLSLFYPHNQILSTGSRICDRTLIHHLLSNGKNPYHTQLLLLKQTSPITLNPSTNQVRVIVATLQQLLMSSLSRYHTIVNHEDDIHNPAQTICHHSRMILSPRLQHRQESLTVQGTHSLVKNQDTRMTQERTRNRNALLLSTQKGRSQLADKRVITLREGPDETVRRFHHFTLRAAIASLPQILANGAREQYRHS